MDRTWMTAVAGTIAVCCATVDGALAGCRGSTVQGVGTAGGAATMRAAQRSVRLPSIKLLKVVDDTHVYMRTDNAWLERLGSDGGIIQDRFFINGDTGQTERDPDGRSPDEITLAIGETCLIDGKNEFHKYQLVSVRRGNAVIHHTGRSRGHANIDETVDLAPYTDAAWTRDPTDAARVTYREWDDRHRLRIEKQYRNHRLDGCFTQWDANGRPQSETHWLDGERHGSWIEWYPTGDKRHQATYRQGQIVGMEYWWRRDHTVMAVGEHPRVTDDTR